MLALWYWTRGCIKHAWISHWKNYACFQFLEGSQNVQYFWRTSMCSQFFKAPLKIERILTLIHTAPFFYCDSHYFNKTLLYLLEVRSCFCWEIQKLSLKRIKPNLSLPWIETICFLHALVCKRHQAPSYLSIFKKCADWLNSLFVQLQHLNRGFSSVL